ncbi:hypothetical protein [Nostoc sp. ChiSLP03a]|uniref:hypothetical protein n=1 Tax=Nostoc sp. ChiSLP03a TaxID=3075380 RepID=UPI002AD40842|nr:hypothetical protein [Nostoc sp. ChiSLP03a]MDZ8210164.1 hypothetical protein [Nostoc sp. ChiSLP03a]
MLNFKPKQLNWAMFFLLGLGYFSVISHLEINYFFKNLIAIAPIQMAVIIYVTYQRWKCQLPVGEFQISNSEPYRKI